MPDLTSGPSRALSLIPPSSAPGKSRYRRLFRSATTLLASLAVVAVGLTVATPAAAVPAPRTVGGDSAASANAVSDAVFRWGINNESNNAAFDGSINLLSAGKVDKANASAKIAQAQWSAETGNVRIEKKTADGGYSAATWAGLRTSATGAAISPPGSAVYSDHQVVISAGAGTIDPAEGTAEIQWNGSFTVAYYQGLTQFYVVDPKLTVDADGTGAVTATLGGWGTSMDDPDLFAVLPEQPNVVLANLTNVSVTATGISVTPDYLGVQIATGPNIQEQELGVAESGSFPQSFVDFQVATGQASYWYSSGGSSDRAKPALPITVAYTAASNVPAVIPAAITTQPSATSVASGAIAAFSVSATGDAPLSYQWQRSSDGTNWANIDDAVSADYSFTPVAADNGVFFRVVVNNGAETPVTSAAAALSVSAGATTEITGAQLEWAYSGYAQYGVFGPWSQVVTSPNVSLTSRNGKLVSGSSADANTDFTLVRFDGGVGTIDSQTGEGSISWAATGDWVLNAYNGEYGAPDETIRKPILTIDKNGTGSLSVEAFIPAGLDMSGEPSPAVGPDRVTIATFSTVSIAGGVITAVPDFAGRDYLVDGVAQNEKCNGAGGSWPAQWIDFVPESVRSHYYSTSCAGLNLKKPALPIVVTTEFVGPSITKQPKSLSLDGGEVAKFSVVASGNPVSYQWQRSTTGSEWVDVQGATGSTLSFATTAADLGSSFRVIVAGTVVSDVANLTLAFESPRLMSDPYDVYTSIGATGATVYAYATGKPLPAAVQYQLSVDGVNWTDFGDPEPLGSPKSLGTVTAELDGQYWRASFDNGVGSVISTPGRIWSAPAKPGFTQQPVNTAAFEGKSFMFEARSTATVKPITSKWQFSTDNGASWKDYEAVEDQSYASSSMLVIYVADQSMNGTLFRLAATNSQGTTYSNEVSVSVLRVTGERAVHIIPSAPIDPAVDTTLQIFGEGFNDLSEEDTTGALWLVVTDPDSWKPGQPGTTVGSVVDTGYSRWAILGSGGQFNYSITIPAGVLVEGKQYGLATFAEKAGSRLWDSWTPLKVLGSGQSDPVITSQPKSIAAPVQPITGTATATFTVAVAGNPTPAISWQHRAGLGEWATIEGATGAELSVDYTAADNGTSYRAVASNVFGDTVISDAATLTVGVPAEITGQPAAISVVSGENATFSIEVAGSPSPTIQWQKQTSGGTGWNLVAGENEKSLTIPAAEVRSGESYRAIVGNPIPTTVGGTGGSSVISAAAVVTLTAPDGTKIPTVEEITSVQPNTVVTIDEISGRTVVLTVGTAYSGQYVGATVYSTPQWLGWSLVDAAGRVSFSLPEGLPAGDHRIAIVDASGALIGVATFTVTVSVNPDGTTTSTAALASTGTNATLPILAAGLLLVAGAWLAVSVRRRRGSVSIR